MRANGAEKSSLLVVSIVYPVNDGWMYRKMVSASRDSVRNIHNLSNKCYGHQTSAQADSERGEHPTSYSMARS